MSQSYASFQLIRMQNTHYSLTGCGHPVPHRHSTSTWASPGGGEAGQNLDWELKIFITKPGLGLTCCKTSFSSFDSDLSLQADLSQFTPLLLTQNIPKQLGRREKAQADLLIWILDLDSFKRDIFKPLQPWPKHRQRERASRPLWIPGKALTLNKNLSLSNASVAEWKYFSGFPPTGNAGRFWTQPVRLSGLFTHTALLFYYSWTSEKAFLPSLGKKGTKYGFMETNRPFKLKPTELLA